MSNIFTGMLLVFLDFNLNIGRSTIGLIPDFIGYIIVDKGLAELADESYRFAKARGFAKGMAVYTGILYFMDLLGITNDNSAGAFILGLVSTLISLYISYSVVKGIEDMEVSRGKGLNAVSLNSAWKMNACFSLAAYLLILIPFLSVICMLVSLVAAIVFLVALNKSKKLYYGTV